MELHITFYEDRACLWELVYKDYMNRDRKEVAYCQIDAQMSEKYTTIRDDYFNITIYGNKSTRICKDSSPDLLGSQFITMRTRDPLPLPKQYFLVSPPGQQNTLFPSR